MDAASVIDGRLKGRRILVTGGTGFVGSHLVDALRDAGARVRILAHYNTGNRWENLTLIGSEGLDVRIGDLLDRRTVAQAVDGVELVFHLGALISIQYSYEAPFEYLQVNGLGTANVLQSCVESKVGRVLLTSTSEVYGTARYTPIDEAHPLQGQSPYSASKIAAEKMAESFYCSYGLPVVILRPFNVFGPRQSARAIIPTIISQMLLGRNPIRLGALTPVRDFNFVSDTVDAFLMAAVADGCVGEAINIGRGEGLSIGDLYERIKSILGYAGTLEEDRQRLRPERSEVFTLICNNEKARRLLGWAPATSLDDGLRRTADFVGAHLAGFSGDYAR